MAKKEEGNAQIKLGNYQAAYDIYTEALEVDAANVSLNSKLYCNRALAASKVVCVATVATVTMTIINGCVGAPLSCQHHIVPCLFAKVDPNAACTVCATRTEGTCFVAHTYVHMTQIWAVVLIERCSVLKGSSVHSTMCLYVGGVGTACCILTMKCWLGKLHSAVELVKVCVLRCMCAHFFLQLGKAEEAIQDCSRAIELDPGYVRALQRRAKL